MMISKRWPALVAACVALLFVGAAQAQPQPQPPPVEAFGRLPAVADAAISPDGTKVALAQFEGDQSAIIVMDLVHGRRVFASRLGENQQLRGVGWADDQRVTFDVTVTFRPGEVLPQGWRFRGGIRRVDYMRRGVVNLANEHIQFLTANSDVPWADQGSAVIAPIEGDPGFGRIIGLAQTQPEVQAPWIRQVYRINLDNGRAENMRIRGVTPRTIGFLIDDHGNVVASADTRERDNRWRIFVYDGDTPRLLLEDVSDTGMPIDLAGLLPDGRLVFQDWDETSQRNVLVAVDRTNAARETIFSAEQGDVDGSILDPWSGHVLGAIAGGAQHFFDPELAAVATRVAQRISGDARILTWSRDRQRFVIYAEVGLDGGGYYMFEPAANRWTLLGMCYPELQGRLRGAERQAITYAARDGVRIPAYLTLPPGMEQARNAPLVLLVHGGPASRDTLSFDWWASFLASRGYLVLQPNFRGSSGYGQAWEEAGRRQWGGLMQTDVEDGVAALVRAGMVDPARVCIVGASYGGYAALAGATLTPDRYACAVGVAGVYDLNAMIAREQASHGDESATSDYWTLSIGDRQDDRERIASVSPANLVDRVRIPVLLIHGTDDTVVPIQQTQVMERRLREAGKSVRFVELTGDDHWLSDAPTRTAMLREIESFLAQNLGARAPVATPASAAQ